MFMMVNNELIGMWKDAIVTQFWSTILEGQESHKNTWVFVVEVWSGVCPSQKYCPIKQLYTFEPFGSGAGHLKFSTSFM